MYCKGKKVEVLSPALQAKLATPKRGPQKTTTKERITIRLSQEVVEQFRATGEGWQIRVDPELDLAALRQINREKLPVRIKKSGAGGGGGSGTRKRVSDAYLKMLGALGEHFVFQQMKELFADFDITNWRSKAKELFGYDEGNDSLGYDFEYHDMSGRLTGDASVQRCFLEVKSTAQEGTDAFEMTTNEWETAIRCHAGGERAVYVIVRVMRTASQPKIMDILVDPVQLHLDGVLDYSSRDLVVAVGKAQPVSQGSAT